MELTPVSRPGRSEVPDPRMWKKTAMVTDEEAALCDAFAAKHTKMVGKGRARRITVRMTRSDVVRLGTIAFLDRMTLTKKGKTIWYQPEALSSTEDQYRTVRIAGVFTQSEDRRLQAYQGRTGITYSNILREGMLQLVRGELDLPEMRQAS